MSVLNFTQLRRQGVAAELEPIAARISAEPLLVGRRDTDWPQRLAYGRGHLRTIMEVEHEQTS